LGEFHTKVEGFAKDLENLVNNTVCSTFNLKVLEVGNSNELRIISYPNHSNPQLKPIPTHFDGSYGAGGEALLGINLSFVMGVDEREGFLAVNNSIISANHLPSGGTPVIRLEYDRDEGIEPGKRPNRKHGRHAAHVQMHGRSEILEEVWQEYAPSKEPRLESLHIPVGGRRFRPTVEDFIEFLHLEQLIPEISRNGLSLLNESRDKWLQTQLKSAVRENPEIAAEELKRLGYTVSPPQ
jgi:hypothetical protein